MPTGYTSLIENGTITNGKDFLKKCLRNFGIMYEYIDESLSKDIIPDWDSKIEETIKKYSKRIAEAKEEKKNFLSKSKEEYKQEIINSYQDDIVYYKNLSKKENELRDKYIPIKKEIENWKCSEDFNNIKDFALNQIDISLPDIDFCETQIKYYQNLIDTIDNNFDEDYSSMENYYDRNIKFAEADYEREVSSIKNSANFYNRFIKEIEEI